MKCKCGYEGWAEIGEFKDERKHGLPLPFKLNYRCPKCKTNKDIEHINSIDSIRAALEYPKICVGVNGETREHETVNKVVQFLTGGADKTTVGFGIHCPICHWGRGSAISLEDFNKLKKEFKDLNVKKVNNMLGLIKR